MTAECDPAAQAVHEVEPVRSLYFPAAQLVQVAIEVAPKEVDHVPAGQGVALME